MYPYKGHAPSGLVTRGFRQRLAHCLLAPASALILILSLAGAVHAQEPFKLGVLNDLGGSFADLGGRGSVLAAQMAVDDVGGKVLGRPIVIISADSQNKPDLATAIARQWFDA